MKETVSHLARRIWTQLGPGFSERVYHNAMEVGLRRLGLPYQTERIVPITFDEHVIGNIRADLIVNSRLLVELKSVRALKEEHRVQTLMYMKLLDLPEGLLVNFPSGGDVLEVEEFSRSLCTPNQAPQ